MAKVFATLKLGGEVTLKTWPSKKAFEAEESWLDEKFIRIATTDDFRNGGYGYGDLEPHLIALSVDELRAVSLMVEANKFKVSDVDAVIESVAAEVDEYGISVEQLNGCKYTVGMSWQGAPDMFIEVKKGSGRREADLLRFMYEIVWDLGFKLMNQNPRDEGYDLRPYLQGVQKLRYGRDCHLVKFTPVELTESVLLKVPNLVRYYAKHPRSVGKYGYSLVRVELVEKFNSDLH